MRYLKAILSVTIVLIGLGCSRAPKTQQEDPRLSDKRVVLQVGESKLTMGEVEKHFSASKFTDTKQEFDAKKAFLDNTMEAFLLIEGARQAGMHDDLDSSLIRRNLLKHFYNEKIISKINVTDSEIENFFKKYGGEIQVGHILVADSVRAESLYIVLKDGGDFDKLAKDFSLDQSSSDKGGSLGYAPYGQFDDAFQDMAFKIKIGEFSKPVHTRYGWHIIKVFDRIKNSPDDLAKNKKQYEYTTHQYLEKVAVGEFVNEIRKKYHYQVLQPTIDMMVRKADSVKAIGTIPAGFPTSGYLDSTLFADSERKMYMVKYDGGGISIIDYLNFIIREYDPRRAPELKDSFVLDKILEGVALPPLLTQMAISEGIDKSDAYIADISYLKGLVLARDMTNQIYSTVKDIKESDIEEYYNSHREDFYMPDQIRASGIAVKSKEQAEELLKRIKGGANMYQMAIKYSLDKKTGSDGGELGFFTEARYTPIYQAGKNLQIGEYGGPVELDGNWWIFKVTGRIDKTPKKLDLVKADINSLLAQNWQKEAKAKWLDSMKAKTKYSMDLDLIKNNLSSGHLN
jgi:parvulin-like peptidyl-prolyl isomerase